MKIELTYEFILCILTYTQTHTHVYLLLHFTKYPDISQSINFAMIGSCINIYAINTNFNTQFELHEIIQFYAD